MRVWFHVPLSFHFLLLFVASPLGFLSRHLNSLPGVCEFSIHLCLFIIFSLSNSSAGRSIRRKKKHQLGIPRKTTTTTTTTINTTNTSRIIILDPYTTHLNNISVMATAEDINRLRHGFSSVRISDHINATPPTPTTPTSRMHLLSGLRTAPKAQSPDKVLYSKHVLLIVLDSRIHPCKCQWSCESV